MRLLRHERDVLSSYVVQHEMCISQLVNHPHVVKCFTSFVHGHHLWAIQELMHYGE